MFWIGYKTGRNRRKFAIQAQLTAHGNIHVAVLLNIDRTLRNTKCPA
jgi:hypothetical protein